MAIIFEEIIQSIEILLKIIKKPKPIVNPNLDPVLLVPGIAGSVLTAVGDDGKQERVWVRFLGADHEFRNKLWSQFDPSTGHTVTLDPKTKIVVPEDRYGLYAIDILDPDLIIARDGSAYFHDMIEEMITWGYQEGKTLFGFGYDFRQSNRLKEVMDRFSEKLKAVYNASGGRKVNIITHSMGGLLVKCFMCLHSDVFEKYVKNWIAIATPFRGAPGYITTSLLNGISFLNGWEQNLFISKWSMHQLLIECPSIYELMACPNFNWDSPPLLQIWREKQESCMCSSSSILESYYPEETASILTEALKDNKVNYNGKDISLPFNLNIMKWASETQKVFSCAELPQSIKFYNIYGIDNDTPHSVCYGSEQTPISNLQQLPLLQANFICVDGDGTVPTESAKADGLLAEARVGLPADHRGIICNRHVFRILKHWLNADYDPYYNPLNDYVILPHCAESETQGEEEIQTASFKEQWEIISEENGFLIETEKISSCLSIPDKHTETFILPSKIQGNEQHVEVKSVNLVSISS